MNYLIVYLVYTAIGLATALFAVRTARKYLTREDERLVAGLAFFLWPFVVLFAVVLLVIDRFWEPPCSGSS